MTPPSSRGTPTVEGAGRIGSPTSTRQRRGSDNPIIPPPPTGVLRRPTSKVSTAQECQRTTDATCGRRCPRGRATSSHPGVSSTSSCSTSALTRQTVARTAAVAPPVPRPRLPRRTGTPPTGPRRSSPRHHPHHEENLYTSATPAEDSHTDGADDGASRLPQTAALLHFGSGSRTVVEAIPVGGSARGRRRGSGACRRRAPRSRRQRPFADGTCPASRRSSHLRS